MRRGDRPMLPVSARRPTSHRRLPYSNVRFRPRRVRVPPRGQTTRPLRGLARTTRSLPLSTRPRRSTRTARSRQVPYKVLYSAVGRPAPVLEGCLRTVSRSTLTPSRTNRGAIPSSEPCFFSLPFGSDRAGHALRSSAMPRLAPKMYPNLAPPSSTVVSCNPPPPPL